MATQVDRLSALVASDTTEETFHTDSGDALFRKVASSSHTTSEQGAQRRKKSKPVHEVITISDDDENVDPLAQSRPAAKKRKLSPRRDRHLNGPPNELQLPVQALKTDHSLTDGDQSPRRTVRSAVPSSLAQSVAPLSFQAANANRQSERPPLVQANVREPPWNAEINGIRPDAFAGEQDYIQLASQAWPVPSSQGTSRHTFDGRNGQITSHQHPAPPPQHHETVYATDTPPQAMTGHEANRSWYASIPCLGTCTCGVGARQDEPKSVICSSLTCPIRAYHRQCVGLSSRAPPPLWLCRGCRPKPGQAAFIPSASQMLSASASVLPPPQTPIAQQKEVEPDLTVEQRRVVRTIEVGGNVFYTGSAGTGKSTVLRALVRGLKNQGKRVDIVAPSGIAALAVNGTTIYSYAGWTPDHFKQPLHKLRERANAKRVRARLCATDCLIIDEISMVSSDVLMRLDRIMREVRGKYREGHYAGAFEQKPFGGVQIVATGDFCQLPPVRPFQYCVTCGGDPLPGWDRQDGRVLVCPVCSEEYKDEEKWAFATKGVWDECNFTYIELKEIHRQSDKRFIEILQTCRKQRPLSDAQRSLLLTEKPDPEGAVKLMPTRAEVERENLQQFRKLPGQTLNFRCRDIFEFHSPDEPDLQVKGTPKYDGQPHGPLKALNDHRFEEQIELKKDMLVILLCNLDFEAGLVNGSQGRIIGFEEYSPAQVMIPAKALARTNGPDPADLMREREYHKFMQTQSVAQSPIVHFTNDVTRTIYAQCQISELGAHEPFSILARTQMPLLASWAITCHKSQGMTLSRCIVYLQKSFERGMAYVALSRAKNLEGLKVVSLPRSLDMPGNEEVRVWLEAKFGKT
ncbi:hypothetical protein B0A48_05875 [Cryoendolithus antarcticus]|uniref:ATP-dependent DNA helicase n=1 Tax=Cryoendolithus antarcticus TaxID=1507870 RepID=A0A1V8TC89_9PEZI|nr:hypothetical protein B0A48_05875 [Cryoendolithus antarcticus]